MVSGQEKLPTSESGCDCRDSGSFRSLGFGRLIRGRSVLGIPFVFVAFGDIEQLQTEFARCAGREAKSSLEGRSADVELGRNVAPKLEPDALLVAIDVNRVGAVDRKPNGSHALGCRHVRFASVSRLSSQVGPPDRLPYLPHWATQFE